MKRILACLLALVMVLSMIPTAPAHATEAEEAVEETTTASEETPVEKDIPIDEGLSAEQREFAVSSVINAEVATRSTGLTLSQLRQKFPHGKYWNHADNPGASSSVNNQDGYTSTPCSGTHNNGSIGTDKQTCNGFAPSGEQVSWQCMGYAEKLGYDATGFNPRVNANGWTTYTSVSALDSLKPGDIVRYKSNGHSIYVIGVNGDTVTYTDCNNDGTCVIRWDATISKTTLASTFTHVRSAPSAIESEFSFDFWSGEDGETISGTHTFWWKQEGYGECDVNLDLNGTALGTIYPDENGLFSYSLDTTTYENGTYTLGAIIRSTNGLEKYVTRTIHIDNGSFGFWSGEDGETISGTHTFWLKQTGYENSSVTITIDGETLSTISPDENGLFSYSLDTTAYENGTYTIGATIQSTNKSEKTVTRSVVIDNGEVYFVFWSGEDGETISGTHKFWWKQTGYESSSVTVTIDEETLGTISPDENGLLSYSLDTTAYENGTYTIGATIQSTNRAEKTVTRSIVIDNGEMFFGFWSGEDGETISGEYKFWWKQVGYGECSITLDLNGQVLTTRYPDTNGLISYTLDTTKYENGTYTIGALIQGAKGSEKYVTRMIYINNVEVPKDYSVTYTSASISLAGDIGVNYYAQLSEDLAAAEGAYMEFTVAGKTQTVPVSEAEVDADGIYRFTCKVAAKQMTDTIVGQIYLADGTAVGEAKSYSVKAYCDAAIPAYSQYEDYAELVALMEAMLNYGGYSQVQFAYNTDNLANADLADTSLPTIAEADVAAYAHGATGSEEGISVASVSLLLESNTTIRFYFNLDGSKSIDQYTFYVDGVEVTPVESNGQYYVDKVNVAAKDLDEMATVTVGDLTVNYCGLSYVRQVAVLYPSYYSESLVNVAKALYAYNQAANAYFA